MKVYLMEKLLRFSQSNVEVFPSLRPRKESAKKADVSVPEPQRNIGR
jgi:hypothetical protein